MGVVNKARAKATLVLLARGFDIDNVGVPDIPKKWEKFPNKEDVWCNVDLPESLNTSGCVYKGKKGSIFLPHTHKTRDEHFVIMNPGGKVQVITDTEICTVSFPGSVFIPMGKPHAVKFLNETDIFIMWHPRMKGPWDGDFLNKKDLENQNS